jgi:hypothetical protein
MITRKALVPVLLILIVLVSLPVSTDCVSAQPTGTTKQVIFRDDDVAPTGWINILEAVNQVHIDENVPVTLAIIPHPSAQTDVQLFMHDQPASFGPSLPDATANELPQMHAFFDYMRLIATNPLFEFAQHGYTHQNDGLTPGSHNQSEFAREPFGVQYEAIRQGRDDIKDTFGVTPTTFVPPWDRGDLTTLEALRALGFTSTALEPPSTQRCRGTSLGYGSKQPGLTSTGAPTPHSTRACNWRRTRPTSSSAIPPTTH